MKEYIKKNRFFIIVMGIYAVVSFVLICYHESWRDEAQSWLIVRDLDLIGIIKQMKYEGHPLLWYIIIMPFAKLGFPYFTIKIVSWLITNLAVGIILKKAPFKNFIKILIIFSFPMIYLYPAIARNYCLILLAIVLIAVMYKNRKKQPIKYILSISLLINTHVIMFGLAGMLLLVFYIEAIKEKKQKTKEENKNILKSLILIIILICITIAPLIGSIDTNKEITSSYKENLQIVEEFGNVIKNNYKVLFGGELAVMAIIYTIYCIFYEIKYYKLNFIIILISVIFQLCIYVYVYTTYAPQKSAVFLLIILLFTWIQKDNKKEVVKKELSKKEKTKKIYDYAVRMILITLMILNYIYGYYYIFLELTEPYSSAKETGIYIYENIEENSIITTTCMSQASSIIPYQSIKEFWNVQSQKYFSFVTWDENHKKVCTKEQLIEGMNEINREKEQKIYYIYAQEEDYIEEGVVFDLEKEGKLEKIYQSKESFLKEEMYIIYEWKD